MLRITATQHSNTATLQLEGRITGKWIHELRRECEKSLARQSGVILDLLGVTFVDDEGITVLKALREDGIELRAYSQFLSMLLDEEP